MFLEKYSTDKEELMYMDDEMIGPSNTLTVGSNHMCSVECLVSVFNIMVTLCIPLDVSRRILVNQLTGSGRCDHKVHVLSPISPNIKGTS